MPRSRVLLTAVVSLAVLSAFVTANASATNSSGTEFTPVSGGVTKGSTFEGAKSLSGSIARTDRTLLGRTDSKLVNVVVKYDVDPVASYMGGVGGLAPTSPSVTHRSLRSNA